MAKRTSCAVLVFDRPIERTMRSCSTVGHEYMVVGRTPVRSVAIAGTLTSEPQIKEGMGSRKCGTSSSGFVSSDGRQLDRSRTWPSRVLHNVGCEVSRHGPSYDLLSDCCATRSVDERGPYQDGRKSELDAGGGGPRYDVSASRKLLQPDANVPSRGWVWPDLRMRT